VAHEEKKQFAALLCSSQDFWCHLVRLYKEKKNNSNFRIHD